jgi:hypothetical protein
MNPSEFDMTASRAAEVWERFIGLFGGDAVKRKYGTSVPKEWPATIGQLHAPELQRGMRRLLHSGRDQVPSVPAFLRLCRAVGDDFDDGQRPIALPNPAHNLDPWALAANRHLLAHVMRAGSRGRRYTPDDTDVLIEAKNAWAADMRDIEANHPGSTDVELQRSCWNDYMARAEAKIAETRLSELPQSQHEVIHT